MAKVFLDSFDKMMLKDEIKQAWSDMVANGPDPKNFNHWLALHWAMTERGLRYNSRFNFLLQPYSNSISIYNIIENFVQYFDFDFPYNIYVENGKLSSVFLGKNGVSYNKGSSINITNTDRMEEKVGEGNKGFLINREDSFSKYLADDIAWYPSLQAKPLTPNTNRWEFLFYSDLKRFMQNVLSFICKERYLLLSISGGTFHFIYNTFDFVQELDEKWNYPTIKGTSLAPDGISGIEGDFYFSLGESTLEEYIVRGWPVEKAYDYDSYIEKFTHPGGWKYNTEFFYKVEKELVRTNLFFGKGEIEHLFTYTAEQQSKDYWVVETEDYDPHFNKFSASKRFFGKSYCEVKYPVGITGVIQLVNSLQAACYSGTIDRRTKTEIKPSLTKAKFGKDDNKDYGQDMDVSVSSSENYPFHYRNEGSLSFRDKVVTPLVYDAYFYVTDSGPFSDPSERFWTSNSKELDFTDVTDSEYILRGTDDFWATIVRLSCDYNKEFCYLIESKKVTIPKKIKISVVEAKCCVEWVFGEKWNRKFVELPVSISYDECGYPEVNFDLRSVVQNVTGFSAPKLLHPEGLIFKGESGGDEVFTVKKAGPYSSQKELFSKKQYPKKHYKHRYEIAVPYITLIIDGNEEFVFKADGLQTPPEEPPTE